MSAPDREAAAAYKAAGELAKRRGQRLVHNGGMAFPIGPDGKRAFTFAFAPIERPKRQPAPRPMTRRGVQGELL